MAKEMTDRQRERKPPTTQSAGAVYGLGLVGALVWYWRRADGPKGHLLGGLKAFVWPAFLVYEAFKALDGLRVRNENESA
jgi:hypothetical protein